MNANRRQAILSNCSDNHWKQWQPGGLDRRVWAKLTPEVVIDLLANPAVAARHEARRLLILLETCTTKWQIRATAHRGGFGNASGVDDNLHFNIAPGAYANQWHLRVKETPRLHISRISPP